MTNPYDERYKQPGYYWGKTPSELCFRIPQLLPPDRPLRALDVGCGEGQNAVFLARNGYHVTAFDASPRGVEKAEQLAAEVGVRLEAFVADINEFRLTDGFDLIFASGVFQYVPPEKRPDLFANYREHTNSGGLNAFTVLVEKPFIARAPDEEETAYQWISGEILTYYHDWKIEHCAEEIIDCMSSGVPHQHAVNRIIARKVARSSRRPVSCAIMRSRRRKT